MIKILVADCHPVMRIGFKLALQADPGIDIIGEACNGPNAVKMAAELDPDVVLLDASMPGGEGFKALMDIKKNNTRTKIIVTSVAGDSNELLEGIILGASAFVPANADGGKLLDVIRRVAAINRN